MSPAYAGLLFACRPTCCQRRGRVQALAQGGADCSDVSGIPLSISDQMAPSRRSAYIGTEGRVCAACPNRLFNRPAIKSCESTCLGRAANYPSHRGISLSQAARPNLK